MLMIIINQLFITLNSEILDSSTLLLNSSCYWNNEDDVESPMIELKKKWDFFSHFKKFISLKI